MGRQQLVQRASPRQFAISRLSRILPLYWAVTVCVFAVQFVSGKAQVGHFLLSLVFSSQIAGAGHPLLYVGWTLEYELLFYVLVYFSLFIRIAGLRIFFTVLAILILVGFCGVDQTALFFIYGGLVAVTEKIIENRRAASAWILHLLGVISTLGVVIALSFGFTPYTNTTLYGLMFVVLLISLLRANQAPTALAILGDASFSMYLLHVPVLTLLLKLHNWLSPIAMVPLAVLTVILVSIGSYKYFERPTYLFSKRLGYMPPEGPTS